MVSEDNRFFRLLWRFNAVIIAAVGIGTLVLIVGLGNSLFGSKTYDRPETAVVSSSVTSGSKRSYSLGEVRRIEGTPYLIIPLLAGDGDEEAYSFKSGGSSDPVNYLFVNSDTGSGNWLQPAADQRFLTFQKLFETAPARDYSTEGKGPVTGIVYALVEADTNGDKRLTAKDRISIAVSGPDGTALSRLVDGIEGFYSIRQMSADRFNIIYQKDGATLSEIYDAASGRRVAQSRLPQLDVKK